MEVDEEVDSKKKLDERKKKSCKNCCQTSTSPTDMEQRVVDEQKEKWQQELQDVEEKRIDVLLEHRRMQKRAQKVAKFAGQKEAVPEGRSEMQWRCENHCV